MEHQPFCGQALCRSLNGTSIVELTVSRNDHISDASMSLATLKAWPPMQVVSTSIHIHPLPSCQVMAEALKDSQVTHLTLERLQKNEGFKAGSPDGSE